MKTQRNDAILSLSDPVLQDKIIKHTDCLKLSNEKIIKIHETLLKEMQNGLSEDIKIREKSSLLMINTFVPTLDSIQKEHLDGDYLSLDLGSTNFRVLHNHLVGNEDSIKVRSYDIPENLRKNNTVVNLFDFMAKCIKDFMVKECPELALKFSSKETSNDNGQCFLPLGFTFSFPMEQLAINVGELKTWTKNFDLPDAIGKDARQLLQESINRVGNDYNVQIVAIINDSTGTMVKGSFMDRNCIAGFILGTGSNSCYVEKIENIKKWRQHERCFDGIQNILVNTECGGFGDNGCLDFVKTEFDRKLDSQTLFPGSFTFEKYFAGHFLGEICRTILDDLVDKKLLFSDEIISENIQKFGSITTKEISIIENAESDEKRHELLRELLIKLGHSSPNMNDILIVEYIIEIVTIRASQLVSIVLATFIIHSDRNDKSVIAIDGSLYREHKHLQELIDYFIGKFLLLLDSEHKRSFEVIVAEDGSGMGAGIVAALATKLDLSRETSTL